MPASFWDIAYTFLSIKIFRAIFQSRDHTFFGNPKCSAENQLQVFGEVVGLHEKVVLRFTHTKSYPPKTDMTMEAQPFEDVSSTKHVDFPLPC